MTPENKTHSPLPWKHCDCGSCGLIWSIPQDFCVAGADLRDGNGEISEEQRQANAALIVEAVNSHAALKAGVTRLTSALKEIEDTNKNAFGFVSDDAIARIVIDALK